MHTWICVHLRMGVYECGFVHGGMRLCECECVFTMYMSACVSLNMYIYMVVYICVCAHVYMPIYRCACMFLYVRICSELNVCVPCQIHILKS